MYRQGLPWGEPDEIPEQIEGSNPARQAVNLCFSLGVYAQAF